MYGVVGGKVINLCKSSGIINKETDFLSVLFRKMLFRHLKRLKHTLSNGNTGHYNDELTPSIMLIQFIHGFNIGIGLSYAGLHLDG